MRYGYEATSVVNDRAGEKRLWQVANGAAESYDESPEQPLVTAAIDEATDAVMLLIESGVFGQGPFTVTVEGDTSGPSITLGLRVVNG